MSYLGCSVRLYLQLFVGGLMSYLECSVRLYLQLFVTGRMSCLRCLCLFAYSGVQHILCCVFALFFFVLLPVSQDCPFLIAPSVFSNVCLLNKGILPPSETHPLQNTFGMCCFSAENLSVYIYNNTCKRQGQQ